MTMRKVVVAMTMACLGISLLLLGPADLPAQWGAIQQGIDAAKGAKQTQEPAKKEEASGIPNLAQTGPVNQAPVTYKNTVRKFSFILPTGWEPVKDPNANDISVGKPGTRSALAIHITQMVPSFPAKASVDASLKTAKEEVTINNSCPPSAGMILPVPTQSSSAGRPSNRPPAGAVPTSASFGSATTDKITITISTPPLLRNNSMLPGPSSRGSSIQLNSANNL
jgi:hypothetical protein